MKDYKQSEPDLQKIYSKNTDDIRVLREHTAIALGSIVLPPLRTDAFQNQYKAERTALEMEAKAKAVLQKKELQEKVEAESGITDVGEYHIQVTKTIYTYSDLQMEQKYKVKDLIGRNDYELYKEYFGEVEEA